MEQGEDKTKVLEPTASTAESERARMAQAIADRLDGPLAGLGIIFLALVSVETFSEPSGRLGAILAAAGWVIWALFAAEFLLRLIIAPSNSRFLAKNWWQLIFLLLPFLRFLRIIRAIRAARVGRVISSAVRSARTARQKFSSRVGWLLTTTAVIILASSQILFGAGAYENYGEALYAAALATVAGEPTNVPIVTARIVDVILAAYSVVVFATVAGAVGAYLLEEKTAAAAKSR